MFFFPPALVILQGQSPRTLLRVWEGGEMALVNVL